VWTIYPNPAKHIIHIIVPDFFIGGTISLVNEEGKMLIREKLPLSRKVLDNKTFAAGVYFVVLRKNDRVISKKVVLE
jgi:hypothetical protein